MICQVKSFLVNREDIFEDYNKENFENEFKKYFIIQESNKLLDSTEFYIICKRNGRIFA